MLRARPGHTAPRRGVAAVELAVLLPVLAFLFVVSVDFVRCYYFTQSLITCARNGAVYGSYDPTRSTDTAGIAAAALADASNFSTAPTVESTTATDEDGNPCVRVTVIWTFNTISRFPGVPSTMELRRSVQMRVTPNLPRNS